MKKKLKKSWLRKALKIMFLTGVAFVVLLFTGLYIYSQIIRHRIYKKTTEVFQLSKKESLLPALDSDQFSLSEKNRIIELLGVKHEQSALPKLESLVTGQKCDHAYKVCQYNLTKSIMRIKGEYSSIKAIIHKDLLDASQF